MPVLEGWESVQRQGQDIADGLSSLLQRLGRRLQTYLISSGAANSLQQRIGGQQSTFTTFPAISPDQNKSAWLWPWPIKTPSKNQVSLKGIRLNDRRILVEEITSSFPDSSDIHELVQRIWQAGADLGANVGSIVANLSENFASSFREDPEWQKFNSNSDIAWEIQGDCRDENIAPCGRSASNERPAIWTGSSNIKQRKISKSQISQEDNDSCDVSNENLFALFTRRKGKLHRQGSINIMTMYDSRTQEVESSVTARGDLWRAEASHGGSSMTNGPSPLYLLQIGPILLVRDSTVLLPVHISKQHLLWYGFDRKNGVHSVCPAVWSKHRRWLMMSMICISPFSCSFIDLQFPNGQLTYVAGEGVTGSVFCPFFGGLLQAQAHRPRTVNLSFSTKMIHGMRFTPTLQISEKSLSLDVVQPVAWQRSGIMVRPTLHLRFVPTVGGRNAGWRAELTHSPRESISWACGCNFTIQPTAYASISLGKSKREGNDSGSSGLVLIMEIPLESLRRSSFCLRLNSGVEF